MELSQIAARAQGMQTGFPGLLLLCAGTAVGWGYFPAGQPRAQAALARGSGVPRACVFAVCFACFGSLSAGVASLTPQVCLRAGEHWHDHAIILSPERGAKPVTNFVKNLSALSDWYSVYTSAIAFTVSAPGAGGASS